MPENQPPRTQTFTLGGKLSALVFATVIVTLALMGGAFWWIMDNFHEAQARAKVTDATQTVRFELDLESRGLEETTRRLAGQAGIISSVNLIHSYEDPANYQPLVFDLEKRTLAAHLGQVVLNGGFDMIATYAPDGRVTAFALREGSFIKTGFQTYNEGASRFVVVDAAGRSPTLEPFTPPDFMLFTTSDPAARAGRLLVNRDARGLMLDMTAPVVRQRSDGARQNLGWIRATRFLDDAFFATLGAGWGVDIALSPLNGSGVEPGVLPGPIPQLRLDQTEDIRFAWGATAREFIGALGIPLSDGSTATLSFAINKADLMAGLVAFRDAALAVAFLAALVFLPGMLLFMRGNVTRPLRALMESAQSITRGEWVTPAGTRRNDEIGALAQAINVMAQTVQARERELREKQSLVEGMINNAPSLIQVKDAHGRYIMVNNRWEEFFGQSQREALGLTADETLSPASALQVRDNDDLVRRTRMPHQFEEQLEGVSATRTFDSIKFPLLDEHGEVFAVCGISQDITERKAAEERLKLTQRVVDETAEGIMITDAQTRIIEVNPAFSMITGYARDEVLGHTPALMGSGRHDRLFYKEMWNELLRTGQWSGEIWDRRKNGQVYPKWLSISAIYDAEGHVTHYVGVFSDITKVKETERQLEHLAHYDSLTGLPNRILFQDRLRRALARHRRHAQKGALMFLDLDRFKQVNDTLGHEKGDELLIEATARLLDCVREDDTVARLGGDEFTVVLNDLDDETLARDVAERIIRSLEKPFDLSGNETFISASIGIVFFPGDGDTIEELTRNADMAMYEAKNQGRATFRFFNEGMNARILERMVLEGGLRTATQEDQLRLFYQPKFDIPGGRIVSVEALVRWIHPERGLLGPDKFIPLAEETGLILEIGRWVLFEACRQARAWIDEHGIALPVAVNLSARQFADPGLSDDIAKALEQSGLDASMLAIEVTESMIMDDVNRAVGVLRRLKRLGLSIAIDDFGTGYSSLNQLRRLPVDELKIDRTFVSDIPDSVEDMEIVTAIISMAKSLKLSVIAEGVETLEQLDFLRAQGCDLAQGFLIGKPVEKDVLPLYLRDDGPNAEVMAHLDPATRSGRTLQ